MSNLRRRSLDSDSPALQELSPASSGGSAPRQTSLRLSRRSGSQPTRTTTIRASASGTGSGVRSQRSSRTRRPTPIVRRRRVQGEEQEVSELSATEDEGQTADGRRRRTVTVSRQGPDGNIRRRQVQVSSNAAGDNSLCWYERLMPEFFLNMTAPITGYESRLDSDVEDDEYEILERQRLKRNRRVRRRLFGLLVLATAAGVFLYSRGRLFRKTGVKAAVNTMKHRIEGGLAKTIQETMGK